MAVIDKDLITVFNEFPEHSVQTVSVIYRLMVIPLGGLIRYTKSYYQIDDRLTQIIN